MENNTSFRDILNILACPKCRGSLVVMETAGCSGLHCRACALVYPVKDDIPVLLIEEAVSQKDWEAGKCCKAE